MRILKLKYPNLNSEHSNLAKTDYNTHEQEIVGARDNLAQIISVEEPVQRSNFISLVCFTRPNTGKHPADERVEIACRPAVGQTMQISDGIREPRSENNRADEN